MASLFESNKFQNKVSFLRFISSISLFKATNWLEALLRVDIKIQVDYLSTCNQAFCR